MYRDRPQTSGAVHAWELELGRRRSEASGSRETGLRHPRQATTAATRFDARGSPIRNDQAAYEAFSNCNALMSLDLVNGRAMNLDPDPQGQWGSAISSECRVTRCWGPPELAGRNESAPQRSAHAASVMSKDDVGREFAAVLAEARLLAATRGDPDVDQGHIFSVIIARVIEEAPANATKGAIGEASRLDSWTGATDSIPIVRSGVDSKTATCEWLSSRTWKARPGPCVCCSSR
jgi:hypothetical protein